MIFNTKLIVNPKGLETFGFQGQGSARDNFGLLTRGLVWQVTDIWTSRVFSLTTTWASQTPSITTTWVTKDSPIR